MAKKRPSVPKNIHDQVLAEYNHRCAKCGAANPQIHHIDQDTSNNDPMNLIPLCPNCHLSDQHSPTRSLEPGKLVLFRQYKDPAILSSQFHPLFTRLQFLETVTDDSDAGELQKKAKELVGFIAVLKMGTFYSKKIDDLLQKPCYVFLTILGDPESERETALLLEKEDIDYRIQLRNVRKQIYELAVELLRFQDWISHNPGGS